MKEQMLASARTLPMVSGEAMVATTRAPRVLILEDDERVRSELVLCLSEEGFDCLACRTAEQAIQLARENRDIAVGVIDIRLPGKSGLDFIAAVRERDATYLPMRFIVMSGHVDLDNAMQALRLKVDDLLSKPVDPRTLISAVTRSLETVSVELVGRGVTASLAEQAARDPIMLSGDRHGGIVESFLNLVSHELRTPLVPIIGYSEMLTTSHGGPLSAKDCGERIRLEAVKLLERIDSVIDLARLIAGDLDPRPAIENPIRLLEMVRQNFAGAARAYSVRIDATFLNAPNAAFLDRSIWVQAVAHVLRNAIEHATRDSAIEVELETVGDELRCAIRNAGPPMDKAVRERATLPFRQGSEGRGRRKNGLGLGLTLARHYMDLHGGHLSIDGVGPAGKPGTTVVLAVPAGIARPPARR